MTSYGVRWVRALTLSSVLFAGGLRGHAAAGGFLPAVSVLIPLFVLTVVAMSRFVGAPLSLKRAVAFLLGGQMVLHAALQLLGRNAVPSMAMSHVGADVAATTGSHVMDCPMIADPSVPVSGGVATLLIGGSHLVMLFAHLAAAVAVGLWLVAGERVLWTLLELSARPVVNAWRMVRNVTRDGVAAVVIGCSRPLAEWSPQFSMPGSVWALGVAPRRGPPALSSAGVHAAAAL